jgi:hypothetical protein
MSDVQWFAFVILPTVLAVLIGVYELFAERADRKGR